MATFASNPANAAGAVVVRSGEGQTLRWGPAGKVRILAQFHDFHGWDMKALWDDIKFSTTHCTKIERIALVGEKKWEQWMAKVCKPFTMAKIQYFDVSEMDAAIKWLEQT